MTSKNILKQKLIDCEALKFGDFTLTSGKKSNYYVNMKLASSTVVILSVFILVRELFVFILITLLVVLF